MESKKPELDEALSSTYILQDPEMGDIRPRHDGASSSRGHESESPEQDIDRISDAFYTFYEPSPASDANLDIFFFHGLECEGADAQDAHLLTWKTSGGKEEIWPQKWLSKDFPQARIISVRYDCFMKQTDTGGRMDLYLIGENLVQEIGWAREYGDHRPVILVGHGFGGVVIKKLCVYAQNKIEKSVGGIKMSLLLESIRGFFFYATPHLGMQGIEPQAKGEGALVRWMRTLNSDSSRLHEAFSEMWQTRRHHWTIYGLGGTEDFIGGVERRVQLGRKPLLMVPKLTVGVDALLTQILEKHIVDHKFVGFCGMGGAGKTTLSKLVFNKAFTRFEYCCFVEEIKLISGTKDEVKRKIWEKMRHHGVPVRSASGSSGGDRWYQVNGRSLLVIFDDVEDTDHVKLLKEIAHDNGMEESRFILTSRDVSCLEDCRPEYEVHICTLDSLQYEDANKLFITYAFPEVQEPPESFKLVVEQVVDGCGGLPLTLEVLGNYLKGKSIEKWKEIPVALRECDKVASLEEKVWSKLQLSYDRLPEEGLKQMFLDIATFFLFNERFDPDDAIMAWDSLFGNAHNRLQILEDRALVRTRHEKIGYTKVQRFYMHEHLRRMGQRIGRLAGRSVDESLFFKEASPKLNAIRYMELYLPYDQHRCRRCRNRECPLPSTLVLFRSGLDGTHDFLISPGAGGNYPDNKKGTLTLTRWCRRVLFRLKETGKSAICAGAGGNYWSRKGILSLSRYASLVKLDLLFCRNVDLGGMNELRSLRVFKICRCNAVQNWPTSLRELKHLERLDLEAIDEPFDIPTTIGDLTNLQHLSIKGCKVRSVPSSFQSLTSLRHLEVDEIVGQQPVQNIIGSFRQLQVLHLACWRLVGLGDALQELTSLKKLTLRCEGILELPDTLGDLTGLEKLDLSFPQLTGSGRLPEAIRQQSHLQSLSLFNVKKLATLPEALGNLHSLRELRIETCEFVSLPEGLGQLSSLRDLTIRYCGNLKMLPETIGDLSSLTSLQLHGVALHSVPESLGRLSCLTHLTVIYCEDLKTLPETIGDLSSLTSLDLSGSGLHSLPESLGRLSRLTSLDLSHCRYLKTIPETIGNLTKLRNLDLSESAVHSLPDTLGGLSKLEIYISECRSLELSPNLLEKFRLEETGGIIKKLVAK
ncbi:hypothetical protein R1sor_025241 [Riccia sorocarpa]|uniref:NB-ARC domain-containing protein n=1 Tax=Riccia sorocarpa TaxID=122646 RepID=A0ABD3G8J8_9MARC